MNNRYNLEVNVKREKWNKISRIAAFFTSIAIWWVSINFSVAGFNFEQPGFVWIGWVLGISVTVIEIVFNKPGVHKNLTLWVIGLMAYVYGMYTNIIGIHAAGNGNWIWAGILGAIIEWVPEVLFVWSILGIVTQEGDFVGNIIKMFSGNNDDDERGIPSVVVNRQSQQPAKIHKVPYVPPYRPQPTAKTNYGSFDGYDREHNGKK